MLKFGRGNAKLDALEKKVKGKVYTFSLLSGSTCPYAKECKSTAVVGSDGKRHIVDGPHTQFRCFSASQEVIFNPVYNSRKANGDAILSLAAQSVDDAAKLIVDNLPKNAKVIRIHVGGDFKTQAYFDAWLAAARKCPSVLFYAYTKSLPFWVARLGVIPSNFILTASYGGYRDELIEKHNLRYVKVVYSKYEARKLKLPIDHDDSHAIKPAGNFALLIHGIQPAGSKAGKAVSKLDGVGSYGKKGRK